MEHIKTAIDLFVNVSQMTETKGQLLNDAFEELLNQFRTFQLPSRTDGPEFPEQVKEIEELLTGNLTTDGGKTLYALCIKWPPEVAEALLPIYMLRNLLRHQQKVLDYSHPESNWGFITEKWGPVVLPNVMKRNRLTLS